MLALHGGSNWWRRLRCALWTSVSVRSVVMFSQGFQSFSFWIYCKWALQVCEVVACRGSQRRGVCLFWPPLATRHWSPAANLEMTGTDQSLSWVLPSLQVVWSSVRTAFINAIGFIYSTLEVIVYTSLWIHIEFFRGCGLKFTAPPVFHPQF